MNTEMNTEKYLKIREGTKRKDGKHILYQCPKSKLTIGYGHNLEAHGISDAAVDQIFRDDLSEAKAAARKLLRNFDQLNEVRRTVVLSLIFQNGVNGFEDFRRTRMAIETYNWEAAAREIVDSEMYRDQVAMARPGAYVRAQREADMMKSGEWID